ncbi:MAG: glycerophosphodiester phosphodiesterase family protein [Bacteroidota bacterium]|jgi:glycerophosphoryl diester phosphodiesterase
MAKDFKISRSHRFKYVALAALMLLSNASASCQENSIYEMLEYQNSSVYVVAHMADPIRYPENSLAGLAFCIENGVDVVELDVQRTRDGKLILMHDATLNRTTNGKGKVANLNWDQVSKLKLKDRRKKITEHGVPLLEDALKMARGKIVVNIDKAGANMRHIKKLVDSLQCGDYVILKGVVQQDAPIGLDVNRKGKPVFMPIFTHKSKSWDSILYRYRPPMAELLLPHDSTFLTRPGTLNTFKDYGCQIWVNALYDQIAGGISEGKGAYASWDHLLSVGPRFIQTDYPIELMLYLSSLGLRTDIDTGRLASIARPVPTAGASPISKHTKNTSKDSSSHKAQARWHIVISGDTLNFIARKYGMALSLLLHANPRLTVRSVLQPGQKIRIPN